jgi:hypothetical protein
MAGIARPTDERSSFSSQDCFRFLQVEFDLIKLKFYIWDRTQCIMKGVVRCAADDHSMHLVAVLGYPPLDPSDVPKKLANRLVAGLIALQFNYQPEWLRLMLGQKIDAANSSRILISGILVTGFPIERPLPAKFQMVPVIPQKLVQMSLKGEPLLIFD